MIPAGNPFEGRSILDLEAERSRLECELEELHLQHRSATIAQVEKQLDQIADEIERIGHTGR